MIFAACGLTLAENSIRFHWPQQLASRFGQYIVAIHAFDWPQQLASRFGQSIVEVHAAALLYIRMMKCMSCLLIKLFSKRFFRRAVAGPRSIDSIGLESTPIWRGDAGAKET
jgi:hypothetical protein